MSDKYKGVVEIDILGAKRGFKFGMMCNAMTCKLEGVSLAVVQQKINEGDPGTLASFYYAAAIQYHNLMKCIGEKPSIEEVANWIDNMSLEQSEEAVRIAFAQYTDPNVKAP